MEMRHNDWYSFGDAATEIEGRDVLDGPRKQEGRAIRGTRIASSSATRDAHQIILTVSISHATNSGISSRSGTPFKEVGLQEYVTRRLVTANAICKLCFDQRRQNAVILKRSEALMVRSEK